MYIEANYSSNITPQSGDEFELIYMVQGGTDSATITLDASNYVDDTGMFELPEAYYEITAISYKGSNPSIVNEGYGVRRDFVSSQDGGSYIYISIGQSANIALEQNYEGALFVDPANAINENEAEIREEVTSETTDTEEVYSSEEQTSEVTEETLAPTNYSTEEVEVEHYDENEEVSDNKNSGMNGMIVKLVGVGFIAIIGFAIIFILHKMGKV